MKSEGLMVARSRHRKSAHLGCRTPHLLAVTVVSLLLLAWPRSSRAAIEIWTSDDGLQMVEFSPSLKMFFFGTTGFLDAPSWYLEMPAEERATLGLEEWIYPNVGGGLLNRIRLRFLADLTSRVRFVIHYEHRPRVLSHGRILSAASSSLQGDEAVPLRIHPLQWTITSSATAPSVVDDLYGPAESTFVWEHEIDRVFFLFSLPRVDITIGRQAISWGMGRLWSPLDVFAPMTPTEIDREEARGVDAVKLTFSFSETALMEVVLAAGRRLNDDGEDEIAWSASSLAWMLRWNIWHLEWMLMAGKVGPAEVVGGGVTGQIRGVAVRGEISATSVARLGYDNPLSDDPDDPDETRMRATVGVEFGTSIGLTGIIEYHYNGYGVLHTGEYLEVAALLAPYISRGLVSGLAQHYAGVVLAWQPLSVLSLSMIYMQNLQDGSLLLGPSVEYSVSDAVRLAFVAYVPIGRDPEWRGDNLLASELVLHSEFGVSPQLYVLQLRVNI